MAQSIIFADDHEITSWEHCFNDNCNEHGWEKVEAGYYPQRVGEKGELSKNDRGEHNKRRVVRTWLGGEESEKTMEAIEGQISDLRSQLDRAAQIIVAKDNELERLDKEKEKLVQAYNRCKQRMGQIGVTSAKIIICVPSVMCIRHSGRSKR